MILKRIEQLPHPPILKTFCLGANRENWELMEEATLGFQIDAFRDFFEFCKCKNLAKIFTQIA